jgi:hypothetical protein
MRFVLSPMGTLMGYVPWSRERRALWVDIGLNERFAPRVLTRGEQCGRFGRLKACSRARRAGSAELYICSAAVQMFRAWMVIRKIYYSIGDNYSHYARASARILGGPRGGDSYII